MRIPARIGAIGITGVSASNQDFDVCISGTVTSGLTSVIGRQIDFQLPQESLNFLLTELVRRDQSMFLRIAEAIKEANARDDVTATPNERLAWSRESGYAYDKLIRAAVAGTERVD
jgi:hypothetical protein